MGGSESRCCTDTPEKKTVLGREGEEFPGCTGNVAHSTFKTTRILHNDPRSPSQHIDRTPIEVISTPVQPKPLMRVQPMIDNALRNRHGGDQTNAVTLNSSKHIMLDPRSPGPPGSRTPITAKSIGFSKDIQENQVTAYATVLDPRSPSQEIVRTPLLVADTCENACHKDEDALVIRETPKKQQGIFGNPNPSFSPDLSHGDPRSPTQGIERTPVAGLEKPDHKTDMVSARNLHDPRSPTTEVPRTPIGALFSGHRELRRTVLMTNALMASPISQKLPQNSGVTQAEEEEHATDYSSSQEQALEDEIPSILRCTFDFNNSCSSSMVASIGSEVDCISLDDSLEGAQIALDIGESVEIDSHEKQSPNEKVDVNAQTTRQHLCFMRKPGEKDSLAQQSPGAPLFRDSFLSEECVKSLQNAKDSLHVLPKCKEHEFAVFGKKATGSNKEVIVCEKDTNEQRSSDAPESKMPFNKVSSDTVKQVAQNAAEAYAEAGNIGTESGNDSVRLEELESNCHESEVTLNGAYQKNERFENMESQVADVSGNMVNTAIIPEVSEETVESPASDEANGGTESLETSIGTGEEIGKAGKGVCSHSVKSEENAVLEQCVRRDVLTADGSVNNGVQTIKRSGNVVLEKSSGMIGSDFEEMKQSELVQRDIDCYSKAKVEHEDKKDVLAEDRCISHKEKKVVRKLRTPTIVTHRRKKAHHDCSSHAIEGSPVSHINKCASDRKSSLLRRPKAKSASDDFRDSVGVDQENSKSTIAKPSRKSESKLVTPTAVRSPLAVLTNDAKAKFSSSPARTTKLPKYHGTPPFAVGRSLSVSFSGRLPSSERQKSGQSSFTFGKEN